MKSGIIENGLYNVIGGLTGETKTTRRNGSLLRSSRVDDDLYKTIVFVD